MKTDGLIPAEWVMFQLSGLCDNREATKDFIRQSGVDPEKLWFAPIELKCLISNAMARLKDGHYGHSKEGLHYSAIPLYFRLMNTGINGFEAIDLLSKTSEIFTPNHLISHSYDGDDVIIKIDIRGIDGEHSSAAELSHIFSIYAGYCSFVGKLAPMKMLYSRSKLYTSMMTFNFETNCPIEYADFSGFRFSKAFLDLPRRTVVDRNPLYDATRWSLLTTAMRSVSDYNPLLVVDAAQLIARIETKAKSLNVDVRQKRRIFKSDTHLTERDLHKSAQIAQSMVLLVTTNILIEDIAAELGFSDERSFRRFFSNVTGQTPLQYRATHQEPLDAIINDLFGKILENVPDLG